MIKMQKSKVSQPALRMPRFVPVLACGLLAITACAEELDGDGLNDTAQEAADPTEDDEVLEQVFGGLGGDAGTARKPPSIPTVPGWPGGFGPVGGTGKKPDASTPRAPSIPRVPGGWGPVGGDGSKEKKPPRTPSAPWPGTFGGVGAGVGADEP